jgi:hypothetical protein
MSLLSRTGVPFRTWSLALLAVACLGGCQDRDGPVAAQDGDNSPPLEITFMPSEGLRAKAGEVSCGVPDGRAQAYDPDTGVFHVHFKARDFTRGGFEVAKVAGPPTKPVAFRLTGVPTGFGCLGHPLTLAVGGESYALDASCASQYWRGVRSFDEALFRSRREGDAVTVEFTQKGRELLKPGAQVSLEIDTGW